MLNHDSQNANAHQHSGENFPIIVSQIVWKHGSDNENEEELPNQASIHAIFQQQINDKQANNKDYEIVAFAPPFRRLVQFAEEPKRAGECWPDYGVGHFRYLNLAPISGREPQERSLPKAG